MRLRVIDIETTGASPSEIIEIAAVDVVAGPDGWTAEPPRSRLFRPLGEISFHAMAVHHLTPDDFDSGTPAACDDALQAFLQAGERPHALVAHNAAFEAGHFAAAVTAGLEWICTVKAARNAWPEAPGYSNQVLRYWRGLRLDRALAMPPHRAGPDAWVTAHLLIELLASASVEELLAWSRAPRRLDRVPFGKYRGRDWSVPPRGYLEWLVAQADMAEDVRIRAAEELASREAAATAALAG